MSYLTFVHCYHDDTLKKAIELDGIPITGWYDIVIPSSHAARIIKELYPFPSSSLTVHVDNALSHLQRYNALLITDPRTDTGEFTPLFGPYDKLFTSSKKGLQDVLSEPSVKGYLEFETDDICRLSQKDVVLTGNNYLPAQNLRTASDEEVQEYLTAARELAEVVSDLEPTRIYAPLRGAHPIAQAMLWNLSFPVEIYFPVTSSFVKDGRYNNKREASHLADQIKKMRGVEKIIYIEEVVSGGMLKGHHDELSYALKDFVADERVSLHTVGLVHEQGQRFNFHLRRWREGLEAQDLLRLKEIANIFTLDDNEFLGIHYLNYSFGPHAVPYLPDGIRHTKSDTLVRSFKGNTFKG